MADSEAVVAQTSSMTNFESAGFPSVDNDANLDASGAVPAATKNVEDLAATGASTAVEDSNISSGTTEVTNSVADGSNLGASQQFADTTPSYEASEKLPENRIISDDTHGSSVVHQLFDGSALSGEEEQLWSIVKANSLDFNAWTALIEETEKMSEGHIMKIRKVYDAFLAEFPLCYGYWKKYADHEVHLGYMDKVVEVYERAVQGVTYSVDMWFHYCIFAISMYGDPETIRSFKELVASRPLSELLTAEEAAAAAFENSEAGGREVEGEVVPNDVEHSSKPLSASLKDAEELEKYIAVREEIYKKAKEFDSKIIGFETAIRRPYFHVWPLNIAELENWHNYLDFIEGANDLTKLRNICGIICLIR